MISTSPIRLTSKFPSFDLSTNDEVVAHEQKMLIVNKMIISFLNFINNSLFIFDYITLRLSDFAGDEGVSGFTRACCVRPSWALTNEVKVLCRSITVILNMFIMFEITLTTSEWQVHFREDLCEGSQ